MDLNVTNFDQKKGENLISEKVLK